MPKSLVVNCSLNPRAKIEDLVKAVKKFSECTTVRFRDIHASYEVDKEIDAVVISGSAARIVARCARRAFM